MTIQTIECDTAKRMVEELDPTHERWVDNHWRNLWIFRGQADSNWRLVASALREESEIIPQKKEITDDGDLRRPGCSPQVSSSGESGIRTHDGSPRTRVPGERIRPLCYLSINVLLSCVISIAILVRFFYGFLCTIRKPVAMRHSTTISRRVAVDIISA